MKVGDLVHCEDPDGGSTGVIIGVRDHDGGVASFYVLYSNGVDYAYDDELEVINESR